MSYQHGTVINWRAALTLALGFGSVLAASPASAVTVVSTSGLYVDRNAMELRVPNAVTEFDYGGGYQMGMLVGGLDPALIGGHYNSGLLTSRLQPLKFAGGRGSLAFYGQMNGGWLKVDNGNPTRDNSDIVTNAANPDVLGARLRYDLTPGLTVGGRVAVTTSWHNPLLQNDFTDAGCDSRHLDRGFCLYDANVFVMNPTFGKLSFGLGETATNGIGAINLGGVAFVTNNDPTARVGGHEVWGTGWRFNDIALDVNGVTRGNRIRYDSPTFAGFALSASWGGPAYVGAPSDAAGQFWDVALRYAGEFSGFRMAAGAGFQSYDRQGDGRSQSNLTVAGSILHIPTGLYATASVTDSTRSAPFTPGAGESDSASAYYLQGGITRNVFALGKTTFYGEYGKTSGGANAGAYFEHNSSTTNWGLGVVQNIDPAALSLYATYNHVTAEVNGVKGTDIDVVMVGGRIKF